MLPRKSRRQRLKRATATAKRTAHEFPEHAQGFAELHWMTAGLFVAAGAEAAFGQRRGDHRADDAIRWAPLVAAPLAGAAQAARALWPSPTTRSVARLVNTAAIVVGAAGIASSIRAVLSEDGYQPEDAPTVRERLPSLAPLAFGAVGLLGLLLDSEEKDAVLAPPATPAKPRRRGEVKRIRIRV